MTGRVLDIAHDFIVIHVVSSVGSLFASYDLLQAITATGMKFGEKNIFHYHSEVMDEKPLFSLASATKSGEFDLNQMGNFSCRGLTLFMDLRHVHHKDETFELMLSVAEQLAEDLQGKLLAGNGAPWDDQVEAQYQTRVSGASSLCNE